MGHIYLLHLVELLRRELGDCTLSVFDQQAIKVSGYLTQVSRSISEIEANQIQFAQDLEAATGWPGIVVNDKASEHNIQ